QLSVNAPVVPIANCQRVGPATFVSQGAQTNYRSSIQPMAYEGAPEPLRMVRETSSFQGTKCDE
ncbi:hypothetical protein F5051DRAFT_336410, partial [Lentinula edodes]